MPSRSCESRTSSEIVFRLENRTHAALVVANASTCGNCDTFGPVASSSVASPPAAAAAAAFSFSVRVVSGAGVCDCDFAPEPSAPASSAAAAAAAAACDASSAAVFSSHSASRLVSASKSPMSLRAECTAYDSELATHAFSESRFASASQPSLSYARIT